MTTIINFADELDKHVVAENEISAWGKGDTINTYHASSVGMCDYQLFRTKVGLNKPNTSTLKVFFIGTLMHRVMQGLPVKGEAEVPFKLIFNNIEIVGNADWIDDDVVYDFKTKSSLAYLKGIEPAHRLQLTCYLAGLKRNKASVVYIEKNTLMIKQYAFDYDEDLFKQLVVKLHQFHAKFMTWNETKNFNDIPFTKCGKCYACKYC